MALEALYKIELDGTDITNRLAPFLISLELTDERGMTADNLTLSFTDDNAALTLPAPGRQIKLWLGRKERGLLFKGLFTIDELESSGPPDRIDVKASSADFTAGLKVRKETFFEQKTVDEIVSFIAGEHDLKHTVSPELATKLIAHITQTNESDINLLTRLAKDLGAFFAVKNGTLIFANEAESKTASGQRLQAANITRAETYDFRFTEKSRKNKYTGAKAAWHDFLSSEKVWEIEGSEERIRALPGTYESAQRAKDAAAAEWQRLQRGELSLSLSLSIGDPALIPEQPVIAAGFKPIINDAPWIIKSVIHGVGASGLTTEIELETPSRSGKKSNSA